MQNSTAHRIKTPKPIGKRTVAGDQVAKFGAYPCTGSSGEICTFFNYHSFYMNLFIYTACRSDPWTNLYTQ